jgi:hypothetical protein
MTERHVPAHPGNLSRSISKATPGAQKPGIVEKIPHFLSTSRLSAAKVM